MKRKGIANLADDHVEQARWKARLFIDARQQQPTRDWGVFGRLHRDAVAERERWGDGAVREMHRKVPRPDHTHDSEGTAIDSALLAWNVDGQDAAGDPRLLSGAKLMFSSLWSTAWSKAKPAGVGGGL